MAMTFQEIILNLQGYWLRHGCVMWLPHHDMVGAGTNNPATLLRVLGPEPLRIAYVEPSFRPDDGRYADNPNRVQMHHQLQVIIKPIPFTIQQLYLDSLFALGLDYREHDIRFVEDNWESPVIGAWGLGWEVWLDGMEISQYTYFQQAGGLTLSPTACELTYGLERIAMYLQGVDSLWNIQWNDKLTYAEMLRAQEVEYCRYNFEFANVSRCLDMFDLFEAECKEAIANNLPVPAYDYVCRCSHLFNILDTRGAVGVAERAQFFARIRGLSRQIAESYVKQRAELQFPLLSQVSADWQQPSFDQEQQHDVVQGKGTFLCELGFEELASFVPGKLVEQAHELLPKLLSGARLVYDQIRLYVTPRRLAILIDGLLATQSATTRTVKGPRKDVCQSNPQSLIGFCLKNGVSQDDVQWHEEKGIFFATVVVNEVVEDVTTVMPRVLTQLIDSFNCGREMRWLPESEEGGKKYSFNRPIRSLVTLFRDQVISWEYARIHSGRFTVGARWQNSPQLRITGADDYLSIMADNMIVIDQEQRRNLLKSLVAKVATEVDGTVIMNSGLVDEITYLTETPVPFLGNLPEVARLLPAVVIKAVIEKHVRCFVVYDQDGVPLPHFVGVSNGVADNIATVSAGFGRVIAARLTDADFFIRRDNERTLIDFRQRLERQSFHEKLGSLLDKTQRVEQLVCHLAVSFGLDDKTLQALQRAATLSRSDLATNMVTEMTSLQGEIGRLYAHRDGEDELVAEALYEQYLPRNADDILPSGVIGQALGIGHRIDTLIAFLAIGLEPTGSLDPFGLRREAVGLINLVLNANRDIDLKLLADEALKILGGEIAVGDYGQVLVKFVEFIARRLEVALREEGYSHDVVRAVLAVHGSNPVKAREVVRELGVLVNNVRFRETLPAYLRCVRLVNKAIIDRLDFDSNYRDVLSHSVEVRLIAAFDSLKRHESMATTFEAFFDLAALIDDFFNTVLIMDKDPVIRGARLGLIRDIGAIFEGFARLEFLEG
jgi:glycyl-tRNA synthetase